MMIAFEALASSTSPSVIAPTPRWTTSTFTSGVDSWASASASASAGPPWSALMMIRSAAAPPSARSAMKSSSVFTRPVRRCCASRSRRWRFCAMSRAAAASVITWKVSPASGTPSKPSTCTGVDGPAASTVWPRSSNIGRVRAMFDERGQTVDAAGPSTPVQVLGFEGVPEAGDTFQVMADASATREIAQKRQRLEREAQHRRTGRVKTLEDFMAERAEGGAAALRLIIKADQGGPAEALADALAQLSTAEVKVEVVHRGVGAITDSDVLLAKASNAIIIGFHVRPDSNARASAERERVEIRTYRIIYEAVEEVKAAMEGLLAPERKEVVLGEAEVRQLFKIAKVGTIAGSFVRSGIIPRTARVRVIRDGVEVYDGTLSSLKRFKDDAREVREGFECGIGVENFNDIKVGDLIEAYRIEEVARSLDVGSRAKGA